MSFLTLFSLLLLLALFFGVYFAFSTAKEEKKDFDVTEFLKILGLFLLCGVIFAVFVDIFFLATRFFLWVIVTFSDFLRDQIFSRATAIILSLLAINAMGGYLFWEMWKENQEQETEFKSPPEETTSTESKETPAEPLNGSDAEVPGSSQCEEEGDDAK